jgi:hypothetical protein
MIDSALGAYLKTRAAVTAIVGTDVYGDKAPQKKDPPFITYEMSGGDKFYHSGGASDLANADITITCHETSYAEAKALYEILRDELDGFSGTWGATTIRSAFLTEPVNVSQPDSDGGSDQSDWAVRGSLTVMYLRAVPTFGA